MTEQNTNLFFCAKFVEHANNMPVSSIRTIFTAFRSGWNTGGTRPEHQTDMERRFDAKIGSGSTIKRPTLCV